MASVNKGSSVQRTHPLLYWLAIANIVGLPNFLPFDSTGLTHDFGLFNITSISRIALTLLTAFLFVINLSVRREPIFCRKIAISITAWLSLLVWCAIATMLQPDSRLGPPVATDLPLGLFRLGELTLAFVLLLALCTREPAENTISLVVELIIRASWITILKVWIVLPFLPHLVYGFGEDGAPMVFGGAFVTPGTLAFCSCCVFLHSYFFVSRLHFRWLGFFIALITLVMTRARTPQAALLIALGCYVFLYRRKPAVRLATAASLVLFGVLAAVFNQPLIRYISRGQSANDVATLDGRVQVWQACWSAIQVRPILGYGFIAGAKNAIRDHWAYAHWVPPHAHNDLIEVTLQAGLPGCILLIYIYVALFRRCVKSARNSREHLFLFLLVIQLMIYANMEIVLSYTFTTLTAVLMLCFFGLVGTDGVAIQTRDCLTTTKPSIRERELRSWYR